MLRNSGNEYLTKRGIIKNRKKFENIDCGCPKKCLTLLTEDERKEIFESFWNLKNYDLQNSYLYVLVQKSAVKRKRPLNSSRAGKNFHFKYFVKSSNETRSVCKKYFLKTFQISDGRLYRCLSKDDVFQCTDKRGTTSSRKLDDSDIVAHIESFPSYQSHYTRKNNPCRKYLNPGLTIRKMYDLYKEKCDINMTEPKKLKYYNKVFNTKFNLHFKMPHQDTCKTCDDLNLKIQGAGDENARKGFEIQREVHQRKAEAARESLKNDSKRTNEAYILTFDLQKALPFPKLSTSVAYYKRNLYVYNFGIHCFNDDVGYMFVWYEIEGGKGSQDISPCLVKLLKTHAATQNHVIMYSDSCTGQNRNIKMALSLLKLVQEPILSINTIDHKFLVSGHSFLPNDGEFGVIETASRHQQQIFSADQWIDIIKYAKRKQPHFCVTKMKTCDFFSTVTLENSITNRKKTTCGYEFSWLNIRWIRFERNHPLQFKFKETLNPDTPSYVVDLTKKKQGPEVQLNNIIQMPLYTSKLFHEGEAAYAVKRFTGLYTGPYFDPTTTTNITTQLGTHAYIPCKIKQLGNKSVSWIRRRDAHILTVDRDKFTGDWRRRHNAELVTLYGIENIVRHIKANRIRWVGHVSRSEDDRVLKAVLFERPDGRRSVDRPRKRWKDDVEADLSKIRIQQ
ncbi:unnamed protein product [Diabrotica balteata]|uniref:Uncharacterized protein n=1 Tax=Diabrotica balteata TaxID=107213 RepID=A0A9N9XBB4_DIABA|nr:unnamed protein product [Diabrotica balteata]